MWPSGDELDLLVVLRCDIRAVPPAAAERLE
jgi:hypothetical protein